MLILVFKLFHVKFLFKYLNIKMVFFVVNWLNLINFYILDDINLIVTYFVLIGVYFVIIWFLKPLFNICKCCSTCLTLYIFFNNLCLKFKILYYLTKFQIYDFNLKVITFWTTSLNKKLNSFNRIYVSILIINLDNNKYI